MKEFAEILLCLLLVLGLFFLFSGEPDLWDYLHDRAVHAASCAEPPK